ncbi:DNA polymerase III subunit chi [Pandoraea faecigallinarum]|uniref:DNA polymerase III subunit chi n=1 Tax=Pandoraea faecigallinarum TaxID=656179 RepID=A0A0H3WV21_9BURK|nr:DNA polymerase III subunit chi [Pandoraea faecigallinarum]AKM31495.1 DNA polymerase III subunit chi [Pandoraea faecigallinarum]
MTRVDFHTHVANRLQYACRFARKVYGAGQTLVVVGELDVLRAFDQTLWTFSPLEFVPHCFTGDALAAKTPVVLAAPHEEAQHHQVLLNLAASIPTHFARFERVVEIVGDSPQDLAGARERYRFYRDRGYTLNNYDQRG